MCYGVVVLHPLVTVDDDAPACSNESADVRVLMSYAVVVDAGDGAGVTRTVSCRFVDDWFVNVRVVLLHCSSHRCRGCRRVHEYLSPPSLCCSPAPFFSWHTRYPPLCVSVSLRGRGLASSIRRVVVVCQSVIVTPLSPPPEHGTLGLVCRGYGLVHLLQCLLAVVLLLPIYPSIQPGRLMFLTHADLRDRAAAVCVADAGTYTWSMLPREL
jgi:hypothetical protein